MENENFFTESKSKIEEYLHEKLLLIKLQAVKKTTKIFSGLLQTLLIIFFGFFILVFVSIMGAYFFAGLTNSLALGFGIIALIYVILLVICISVSKKIISKSLTKLFANFFLDK